MHNGGETELSGLRCGIKVLGCATARESDVVGRIEPEAQLAAQVGNDHIIDVLDSDTLGDDTPFILCE